MKQEQRFFHEVAALAVPTALQAMLQASFSVADQIMIGQLGSVSVAGVGLAAKFASVFSVLVSAVGAVAGIMIAQYLGQKNARQVRSSFYLNLVLASGIAAVFTLLCLLFPARIMGLYTRDPLTRAAAAEYLRILSGTFLPMAGVSLLSVLLRCMDRPQYPLYAGIASVLLNTGLNWLLIFGKLGHPALGARGAAIATLVSQYAFVLALLVMTGRGGVGWTRQDAGGGFSVNWRQYLAMLLPLLICEFGWSLGENVYAAIYGHLGTASCAAMTLINPVQYLMIGALCGLSQAAGILVGKRLGGGDRTDAFRASRRLLLYGLVGSLVLSAGIAASAGVYVRIYRVDPEVRELTRQILLVYALIAPFKIQNMILGGGILRSGGKTGYVMAIDLAGPWLFGVPLGLLAAVVLKLSIPGVYFLLSLEECVRFALSMAVFRSGKWMHRLEPGRETPPSPENRITSV